ncbi:hypothetical protein ATR1_049c0001 [Acetobacter tropicalis]|nr:hypothetical protein ATR1_049c0001 [Acetobacter tropicalis]
MGQFSVEIYTLPGSVLGENQQPLPFLAFLYWDIRTTEHAGQDGN